MTEYTPPPGPPPGYSQSQSRQEGYRPPPGPPPGQQALHVGPGTGTPIQTYTPPPGPPPSHFYVAPQGPPSSHTYAPPAGSPPSHLYAPPLGPPPRQATSYVQPLQDPPPYNPNTAHDWTVVPDTALLPPPPSLGYEESPTANATGEQSNQAAAWCISNPLWKANPLTQHQHQSATSGNLVLLKPPSYVGDLLPQQKPGHWKCRTHAKCPDSSLLTSLPIYAALHDSPLLTEVPKTIYFELKVLGVGRKGLLSRPRTLEEADAGIAIGFVAPPYPTFRLPGWQRGSLGVHGDDGRKYVNDTYGGSDFTRPFKPGDTVGIGMTFRIPQNPPSYEEQQGGRLMDIEVFFTRNGKREEQWDGNEELDERSEGGTIGLRGDCDLFAAVGVFGGVDFEVYFRKEDWMYKPN